MIVVGTPFLVANLERIQIPMQELHTSTISICENGFATIALLSWFEQNEHGLTS
jgi:hypothetical protein